MGTPYTMYNAEWLVDLWWPDGSQIREQIAYCKSFAVAEAAYHAALKVYPYDRVTFRHGARVIREHQGKWEAAATARKE